jgi:hypothetical protein
MSEKKASNPVLAQWLCESELEALTSSGGLLRVKRLTAPSAMQLDVSFQAQHDTRTENNGPANYANSRHRSDFPERVFLGSGRVVDLSGTSRIVAYVPVLNVIGQQCPKNRIYGACVKHQQAHMPVLGMTISR